MIGRVEDAAVSDVRFARLRRREPGESGEGPGEAGTPLGDRGPHGQEPCAHARASVPQLPGGHPTSLYLLRSHSSQGTYESANWARLSPVPRRVIHHNPVTNKTLQNQRNVMLVTVSFPLSTSC